MLNTSSRLLPVAAAAAAGALLAGGGYAIGAGGSGKTISGCVVTRSHAGLNAGELLIQNSCGRWERPIGWDVRGPQGVQGPVGPAGPQAASAWGNVGGAPNSGGTLHNITVQYDGSPGLYTVTELGVCPSGFTTAEVVSPTPPTAAVQAGQTPIAYVQVPQPGNSFQVQTGYLSSGVFTPNDVNFSVAVYCQQP